MVRKVEKFKRVIFDFDNTLFDTETIKECFWEIADLHGFSKEETELMYKDARAKGAQITFTMESFLSVIKQKLQEKGKIFLDREVFEIINRMENGATLVPGAKKIMEFTKTRNIERYVLSLGVHDWQEKKVKLSGIKPYFDEDKIIYTDNGKDGKEKALGNLFGMNFLGEGTILFNDKPDETESLLNRFPKMIVFLRREPRDKRYGEKDFQTLTKKYPNQVVWSEKLEDFVQILRNIFK